MREVDAHMGAKAMRSGDERGGAGEISSEKSVVRMWRRRRRAESMSEDREGGVLGVRLYGHAGTGGWRPRHGLVAWRLTFGHAGNWEGIGGVGKSCVFGVSMNSNRCGDMRREVHRRWCGGFSWSWRPSKKGKRRRPLIRRNEGEADNHGPATANEGSLVLATANVTSLRRRWPIVKAWPFDAICLQETMLGEQAQVEMEAAIVAEGWTVKWGAPQPLKNKIRAGNLDGRNIYDAKHGGVAVVAARAHVLETVHNEPGV